MKAYHENGDNEQVTYEDGTVVKINVKADTIPLQCLTVK